MAEKEQELVELTASQSAVMVAARCRICAKERLEPLAGFPDKVREDGKAWLVEHLLTKHSKETIIRVYVLGEPWYLVLDTGDSEASPPSSEGSS